MTEPSKSLNFIDDVESTRALGWCDYPRGVIAARSGMMGMAGASEALVVVALRSDKKYSIKCYRHGEFGKRGDGGPAIWSRVGSTIGVTPAYIAVDAIEAWAREIEAEIDWEQLIGSLRHAYPASAPLCDQLDVAVACR
jgi:hypothetical protein